MATELSFVEYVRDQMQGAGQVSFRKMFGEYALYCEREFQQAVKADLPSGFVTATRAIPPQTPCRHRLWLGKPHCRRDG
ncbi:hypothetical protein SAMN05660964_00780 [Thiothrix caldifontis]|uniref:TfoX N-terminal domain-containing protein n=1 Tax=Thiothrix caldifontis TaxID=525918 RepID=A0A1H3XTM6_9GAMM|nr:hypothetical protein [Thiothrix caldifontis]SEA01878.1 hypothetical protein SAMN05660964_00780 [Thiothrix caldifontis]